MPLSSGNRLHADVEFTDLGEWHIVVETGIVPNDDVIHIHPDRENPERHLSQLYGTVEPLLQLGLNLSAILVDIDEVRQRQKQDNYDNDDDSDYDNELSHGSSSVLKWRVGLIVLKFRYCR